MKRQNFTTATLFIGAATLLSRVLGLVREQLFAYFFGAGLFSDAFQVAFRIPNLLRDLFAEGAMSSALVPVYTKTRKLDGEEGAANLSRNVITLLGTISVAIAIFGYFLAPSLVHFYAPGFASVPGKQELTIHLTKFLWLFFPCIVLAAVCMGILNARAKFTVPALASSLFNVISILGLVVFCWLITTYFHFSLIYGAVAAVLLGGLGQWLIQVPALRKEGFRYRPRFDLADARTREIMWLMLAGTFGMAATQINILVNSFLASSEGAGAVSWLHYAFRLMQFPIGVFGVAIATTTLTKVSGEVADDKLQDVAASVRESLRMVLVLSIPSAVGLTMLGTPIVSLLFQHGRFTAHDTEATATALAAYAIGLSAYSAIKVLVPVFYALGKSGVAISLSGLSVLLNIGFCFALRPLGFWGLPLATSLSSILHCILLLVLLRRRLANLDYIDVAKCLFTVLLCSIFMAGILFLFLNRVSLPLFSPIPLTGVWAGARFPLRFTLLFVALGSGVATFVASAKILGLHEINRLNELLWKRRSNRREMP